MADQQQLESKSSPPPAKESGTPTTSTAPSGAAVNLQPGPIEPKDLDALTQYVQELMQQMQNKFTLMTVRILSRIDDMSHRVEDIERNINELSQQAGLEPIPPPPSETPASATGKEPAKEPQRPTEEKQ